MSSLLHFSDRTGPASAASSRVVLEASPTRPNVVRANVIVRRMHYWVAAIIAIPMLVVIGSGLLLQVKKQWTWVQPAERGGTGSVPALDLEAILHSARGVANVGPQSWDDVNRIDLRPGKALAKLWLHNGHEIQVDLGTGRVLAVEYRRSDLIESIHDGSFFLGDASKLGVFLPSGIALFVLLVTGLWMFWLPVAVKRRRAGAKKQLAKTAPSLRREKHA